jgi:DhnA family fructose-bisphosphate aldolase class Ia
VTSTGRVFADDGRAVVLAADHRARGVLTIEDYADYLAALRDALPACDAVMASAQPLADLVTSGAVAASQATYLSINRTGLAGTAFELDDRLVASVERAARDGYTGVKVMTRVDRSDPSGAVQLEMLGRVLEDAAVAGLDVMVEPLTWTDGAVDRTIEGIVWSAVVAHDMGAPLLKVPVPDLPAGSERADGVARIVASVGVPVLFLGGPKQPDPDTILAEVADVASGGGHGLAIGRAVYQDDNPAEMAKLVASLIHS